MYSQNQDICVSLRKPIHCKWATAMEQNTLSKVNNCWNTNKKHFLGDIWWSKTLSKFKWCSYFTTLLKKIHPCQLKIVIFFHGCLTCATAVIYSCKSFVITSPGLTLDQRLNLTFWKIKRSSIKKETNKKHLIKLFWPSSSFFCTVS